MVLLRDPRPELHTLTVVTPGDGLRVRFGLRTVQAFGRDILVNGRPVKLHGYNRHDMYPQLGPSLPAAVYDSRPTRAIASVSRCRSAARSDTPSSSRRA